MQEKLRFLGLDVHADTIAVAVAEADGEVRSLGTIPNRAESIRKLIKKLGPADKMRACYEAEPTGYVVYWQLAELGIECEVVAPTLVPVKAGDRVKTDRRDAEKLARCYRSGDLTAVWVPDEGSEALRDLVRAREAAKQDQMRARHRLSKFLLRSGQRPPTGVRPWTRSYLIWVAQLWFTQLAPHAAAGGLWTTATAYAKFVIELQKECAGESHQVLDQKMAQMMVRGGMGRSESIRWGLGVRVGGTPPHIYFKHGGSVVFQCDMVGCL